MSGVASVWVVVAIHFVCSIDLISATISGMHNLSRCIAGLLWASFAASGCIPIPVSTVSLHSREERPVAVELPPADNFGTFSVPAFDPSGTLLVVYDSGGNLVRILRSADLAAVDSFKPTRRPRRLSFSPTGRFLVIEAQPGWIDAFQSGKGESSAHVDIDSPEAIKDNIQRVEIRELRTGQTISDLSCDAVVTSQPEGGWLWASRWAIMPGYRSSALLEAHFSADETELSALCWNGVRQRWDSRTWQRLENLPPPPTWDALMGLTTALWLAGEGPAGRSGDGRLAILRVREQAFGFATIYIWDHATSQAKQLPGECGSRLQPAYALSRDGNRIVTVCNSGLGYALRAWDLASCREFPLENADFGFAGGLPNIRGEGVALSPDGRYLVVAAIGQMEYLLPNILLVPAGISRSDLRLWSLDTGKELANVPIDDLESGYFRGVDLAFSPDSEILAVTGRGVRLYRLSDLAAGIRQLQPQGIPEKHPAADKP